MVLVVFPFFGGTVHRQLQFTVRICPYRICAIELEGSSSSDPCLTLIAVYHPSTDYPLEAYEEYMTELERAINALQEDGPIITMSYLNTHLRSSVHTNQN